jgi:L-alanine-DL-glutamate epimerase-like enolase superfamily enzyme
MTGVITCAMSALDIALWDIKGKVMGQPIYRLLGGYAQRVPVYATFGLLSYSREELVSVAKALVSEGYNKLKMVVGIDGADNLPEDQARVEALRKGVGNDIQIIVDANHLFSLRQAVELARRIEPYNITWFEEPVHNNDVKDLAELRTRTFIPIAAGQQEGMRWRHRDLIVGNAVDIVQTDAALVGGFSEGLKVAHFAQAYNLPIATHGYVCPHINMHLVAGVTNGWLVEFHALGQKLSEVIFVNPPKVEKGWVTLPEKPGLGMDVNYAALKEYEEN